jgi:hypothetical protein
MLKLVVLAQKLLMLAEMRLVDLRLLEICDKF